MSEPYKTSEIRATVTVSSILPNGDSSIRVEYPTTGASGQKRSFFAKSRCLTQASFHGFRLNCAKAIKLR